MDLDAEIRVAAFERVRALRDLHNGRIPRDALSGGITIRGTRVPIWNYQKGIFKPAALGRDGAALSVQTSIDSPYADASDPKAGHFVYKYRGTDPDHPDNVSLRRAMSSRTPLIYLVAVDPGIYDAILPVFVVRDDREKLQFTLMVDYESAAESPFSDSENLLRRAYATRAAMHRLHQQHFRRIVLRAYSDRCAICRIKHLALLDAAHILPDLDPRSEPVISNGLGLCKIHHSAFDAYILGIDPESRVHIRPDVMDEKDGPMLLHGLQELHGFRLSLPRRSEHRPNRDFLAERFELFRKAS